MSKRKAVPEWQFAWENEEGIVTYGRTASPDAVKALKYAQSIVHGEDENAGVERRALVYMIRLAPFQA